MKKYFIVFFLMLVSLSSAAQTYSKELEKAAKKGDSVAQKDLGVCFLYGYGTDINNKKAYKWLLSSAEQGNADAMFHLARQLKSRLAPGQFQSGFKGGDYYSWIEKAALLGQQNAIDWLKATDNITLWARDGAAQGNKYAQYEYAYSKMVHSEIERRELLKKAAAQGHEQAIRDLAAIREKEIQDSLAQVRIEEERLRVQEKERKRIQEEKLKWRNLSVQLKKPGTLLSVIPIDKLQYIDSLTITGILYETDLKVITEQCKGLKKLDLSNCYTLYSPEELKKQRDQQEAFVGLVKAMGVAANMKYNDYNMSTNDYVYTKLFTKLVEQAGKETKSDDACVIPNYAFGRMPCLEEIVFPTRCSEIGRYVCYKCTQLKKVILPKYVKRMDFASFSFCPNLAEVEFPRTLKSIGLYDNSGDNRPGSFTRTGIKVVDLSKCDFGSKYSDSWTFFFTDCPNIQAVYLPNGVPNIDVRVGSKGAACYVPASVKYLKYSYFSEYHFKSQVPPSGDILPQNCTIYVPKGCTTAYFAKYGSSNKYIEE